MNLDRKKIEEIQRVYLACGKYSITSKATECSLPTVKKYVDLIELDENGELIVPKVPEYDISELRRKMEHSDLKDYSPEVFILTEEELTELEKIKKVL